MRTSFRCILNAASAVCFGLLLLFILGPALLSPKSARALGGGSRVGFEALAHGLLVPLAAAGVVLALMGGTLSTDRRQRTLAASVAGLLGALTILRHLQII